MNENQFTKSQFVKNLKKQADENPLLAIAAGVALITAVSKLLDASTARKAAHTHALEVARRIQKASR